MAEHNETGRKGEEIALHHLQINGYVILETNWRVQRAEVDIIASKGGVLIFIEVKTRSTATFGEPYEFIRPRKWRLLSDAAVAYAMKREHDGEVRFDVISIISDHPQSARIQHLKDVFFEDCTGQNISNLA